MRHGIILLSLLCLSLSLLSAGPEDETKGTDYKRWKNGFVITLKGDTIHGKIKTTDFLDVYYDYQRLVSFKDPKGIIEYSPNDLTSFSYEEEKGFVTLQSVSSPEGDGHVFLKLYCSGICKVYGMMINEIKGKGQDIGQAESQIHSSLIPTEKKYIQLRGSQFYPLKRIGFKKNMEDIFSTCPRIVQGLESKIYTFDNWKTLVKDYNAVINDASSFR
jgi:hypothetical protein